MVFEPDVFASWAGDDLEKEVLPSLSASGHLYAYKHLGFWKSMDTYKDAVELSTVATEHPPPWMERSV
jgi:glucose-1-phosphate cytidylyltransferase